MTESDSITLKRCTKCGVEYPPSLEHFAPCKLGKHGLRANCRKCGRARSKTYRQTSPGYKEKHTAYERERRHQKPEAAEYAREYQRKRREDPEYNEQAKQYQRIRRQDPTQRELDQSKKRQRYHERRATDPEFAERMRESKTRSYRKNPVTQQVYTQKRKARKKSFPDTLTRQQWQQAVDYFHGCCAVCGKPLKDLFGERTAAMDHWIPLSNTNCPGTVVENIVPLCHGQWGCNNSKGGKDPMEWMTERLGKRDAQATLARIEVYFRWALDQQSGG